MELGAYLDSIDANATLLADAARQASLDAAVSSCPEWNVRDLVKHVGGIHRWASSIVAKAMPDNDEAASDEVGNGPDDELLLDWFRDGHRGLVHTLRAAPADLACFTFLPASSPLSFWARRQSHETAIHRVDAQSACGEITPFDSEFARDGIGEIVFGFGARPRGAIQPGTMLLRADDENSAWLVTFGATGATALAATTDVVADATVSGSPSDLYLWLWNRPSAVVIAGDGDVADRWRQVRVRWG